MLDSELETWRLLQAGRMARRKAKEAVSASPDSQKSARPVAGLFVSGFDNYLGGLISSFPRVCSQWTFPENSGF